MRTWNEVAILGVGLIGGSIGLALRKRGLARSVVGIGRSDATLETALAAGAITRGTKILADGVQAAELVIVCTPVGAIVEHVQATALACPRGCLITDAGSTKQMIARSLEQAAGTDGRWGRDVRFVGSHPLAGNEKRGPQHASPDLFVNRTVIVTPGEHTSREDCEAIGEFWRALGARLVEMSPEEHDRAVAATSHVPHLVAAAIASSTPEEYVTLTAGGWLDTTRIAAGDPELWQQILLGNRTNVLEALARCEAMLDRFRRAVEQADDVMLRELLAQAKKLRDAVGS